MIVDFTKAWLELLGQSVAMVGAWVLLVVVLVIVGLTLAVTVSAVDSVFSWLSSDVGEDGDGAGGGV